MTVLTTGKTKDVVATDNPNEVHLVAIDRLTGGDAAKVAEIASIGMHKTAQTANVFTLLNNHGIPTSFIRKVDDKTLLCRNCDMLPLEFVSRRYAYGSFIKRLTQVQKNELDTTDGLPHAFAAPVFELFHKDSVVMPPNADAPVQMTENDARAKYLGPDGWPAGIYTDPYLDTDANPWGLYSAKAPIEGAPLMTVAPVLTPEELAEAMETIVKPTFSLLERAWSTVDTVHGPVSLADMKVELGRDTETGKLLLSDVIDNDSWRVWPGGNPAYQLDKQAFRDGEELAAISEKYTLVTELSNRFQELKL